MNKQGFLALETTIKVIIAIIAIMVLVGLAVKLLDIVKGNQEFKSAEIHIESIRSIISGLEKHGEGEREYLLLNPNNWFLMGFPADYSFRISDPQVVGLTSLITHGKNDIPSDCKINGWNNCLCFCRQYSENTKDLIKGCERASVCTDTNFKIKTNREGNKDIPIFIKEDLLNKKKTLNFILKDNELIVEVV